MLTDIWRRPSVPQRNLIIILLLSAATATAGAGKAAPLIQMGRRELVLGEYDNAVTSFRRAVKREPDSTEGHAGLEKNLPQTGGRRIHE